MRDSREYDVAIVGGGLAGLAAGTRAAQLGCQVIVLEQGEDELYACNSRYAGGWFHLAFHDPTANVEWLVDRLLDIAPDDLNHPLIEAIARNAKRTLDWLTKNGRARFIRGGPLDWHRNLLAPPRPPRPHLVWLGCGPDLLIRALGARLLDTGGRFARGHRVVQLARERKEFVIDCKTTSGNSQFISRTVVMCDGGFAANMTQVSGRISKQAPKILQRNAGTAKGAGVELAPMLGAALTETRSFYGHLHSPGAFENPRLWPYPTIDHLALAGIVVNKAGNRFIDDGHDGVFIANELAGAEDPQDAFAIFDVAAWEDEGRQVRAPCNPILEKSGGRLFRSSKMADLASESGIDPARLMQTVAQYNEAVRNGGADRLPIPKSPTKSGYREISNPPFFAIPICPGITHTMGGIAIAPSGAVEDVSGGSVAGLFAAGSTIGGAEGGRHSFYLGGLCKAATLGLICGESAAQFVSTSFTQ